jgi:hypothetical protein
MVLTRNSGSESSHRKHGKFLGSVGLVPITIKRNPVVSVVVSTSSLVSVLTTFTGTVESVRSAPRTTSQAPSFQKLVADSQRGIGAHLIIKNYQY